MKAIEINVESLKTKFHHSLIQKNTLGVFAAFDNIQIDGYVKDSMNRNTIIVYPNPAGEEIFIRFNQQPNAGIDYCMIDGNGRIVGKGLLNNYRINVSKLSREMYVLTLYDNDKMIITKKFLKQ